MSSKNTGYSRPVAQAEVEEDGRHHKRWNKEWFWVVFLAVLIILVATFVVIRIVSKKSSNDNDRTEQIRIPINGKQSKCTNPLEYSQQIGSIDVKTSTNILENMNRNVDPCENFYEFACHGWQVNNPTPDYAPEWNVHSVMEEKTLKTVVEMMEKPVSKEDIKSFRQAKVFYDKCMKTYTNTNNEYEELQVIIDSLESYGGLPMLYKNGTWNPENFDWMKSIVALTKRFKEPTLFDITSHQDPFGRIQNNTVYISSPDSVTGQRSLRLLEVDTEDLSSELADALEKISEYHNFIGNVSLILMEFKGLKNIDEDVVRDQALDVIWMQGKLAELAKSDVLDDFRGIFGYEEAYARISLYRLQLMIDILMGQNDTISFQSVLDTLYESTHVDIPSTEKLYVANINYVLGVIHLIQKVPKRILANYLHFQMLKKMIPLANGKLRELFESRNRKQYGIQKFMPESYRCATLVQSRFRFALEHKYIKMSNMDECEVKNLLAEVNDMVTSVKKHFGALKKTMPPYLNSQELNLLIEETKACVHTPDWITDSMRVQLRYDGLQLNQLSFLEQYLAYNEWSTNSELRRLRDSINPDKCYWEHFPDQMGAFANVNSFQIFLPLGALQIPLYQLGRHIALNYGILGSTIGHELVHVFSQYGWEKSVLGMYTSSAKCLIDQYNNFTVDELREQNVFLKGDQTLSENFADNGGMRIAYEAYLTQKRMRTGGRHGRTALREYTDDQLFFLGFAQKWCESTTVEFMSTSLKTKEHSPGMFRVLGTLQNSKEFAEAWNCPLGSKMNPRVQKCDVFQQQYFYIFRLVNTS